MQIEELQELLQASSPKVRAIYEAVNELIIEGVDLGSIKVSDITSKAGIGKGTAYDYFESKEEIIAKAIIYNMHRSLQDIVHCVKEKDSIRGKVYAILDNIEENYHTRRSWMQYLNFNVHSSGLKKDLMHKFKRCSSYNANLLQFVNELLEQAEREGLAPKDIPPYYGINALVTQTIGFWYYLDKEAGDKGITVEEAKEFAYVNFLKIIN